MPIDTTAEDALDQALAHYQATHPYWDWDADSRHLVNHGPMASDALVALGRADALPALREAYHPDKLRPFAVSTGSAPALGDRAAIAVWIGVLEPEVQADPLAAVRRWVPRLLDGVLGASLHGLIRTAHGVRAWRRRPGVVRAREVAYGLGLWAAAYQPLSGRPGSDPQRDPLRSIVEVPRLPAERRVAGLISDRAAPMAALPGFAAAVDGVDLRGDVSAHLGALTDWAARRMLVESSSGFAYLHALTSASALRLVLPVLDPADRAVALGGLVRALMAVHGAHASAELAEAPVLRALDGLADAAVATGNDHTIKLAEAVLREEAMATSPARREAAWRAAT